MSEAREAVRGIGAGKLYGSALALGFVVVVSGCSDGSGPELMHERVGQAIQPIIHGVGSGAEQDAVVVLTTFRDGQRRSLCTATLVAPNLLVTARHCVSDTDASTGCSKDGVALAGATVRGDRRPEDLVVFAGKDGIAPDTSVEANASARGAQIVTDSSMTICNHDLAFLVLDRKLAEPIAPIRLGPPRLDETIAAVGWGVDETGALPKTRSARLDVPLVGIGPALYPDHDAYGYGDTEFMVGESACSGDSGSPALAKSGAVLGVAARAGNGKPRDPANYASVCVGETAHAVYTQLAGHERLVVRAFQEAGAPMWLEGQPDPRAAAAGAPEADPGPPEAPPAARVPDEAAPAAIAAADLPPAPLAGGCSMSPDAKSGAVEQAAGFVALLAMLFGLRRRVRLHVEPDVVVARASFRRATTRSARARAAGGVRRASDRSARVAPRAGRPPPTGLLPRRARST